VAGDVVRKERWKSGPLFLRSNSPFGRVTRQERIFSTMQADLSARLKLALLRKGTSFISV